MIKNIWNIQIRFSLIIIALAMVPITTAYGIDDFAKYYLEGLENKQKGDYQAALTAFSKAMEENNEEAARVRFYGMRYEEYFPLREKGICHYFLKQYPQALNELEASIAKTPTDEALKYLKLTMQEISKSKPEDLPEIVQTPPELAEPPSAAKINPAAVAVIIGNRDYQNKDIPPVNYAVQDARLVKEYLIKTFGYREGNIIFRTNATKGVFENIFGTAETHKAMLFDYLKPKESELFVYYSGHGAPSLETRKGYILPVDGNPNNVTIGGYSLDLLYNNLAKLNAKSVVVVTDACFSGAPLFQKASPVGIIVENPLAAVQNTSIINSSSGTELSSWYPQKGHGLFTYFFLLGLTGKADADADKQVTLRELSAFLNDNISYMARELHNGRKQTPTIISGNDNTTLITYK